MRIQARRSSMAVLALSALFSLVSCKKPVVESKLPISSSEPVLLDRSHYGRHLLTPWYPLRLSNAEWHRLNVKPCGPVESLSFEVIVSEVGEVRSTRLLPDEISCKAGDVPDATPAFLLPRMKEASALISSVRFRPWIINGSASSVKFSTALPLAPPERFGPARSFPETIDPSTVSIGLEQRGCEGLCPSYSLVLKADGTVVYTGGSYVAVTGTQVAHISPAKVSALLEQFRKANFLSVLPVYFGADDGGDSVLHLTLNGVTYSVEDSSGLLVGMPNSILDLELAVDEAADSARWVIGNSDPNIVLSAGHK